jgi:hypothetical protein
MANDWKIKSTEGGPTGQLLDGLEIRRNAANTGYELVQVLATSEHDKLPIPFPPFIYKDLIWNLEIKTLDYGIGRNEAHGPWSNNLTPSIFKTGEEEEEGTYTAQAGPSVPSEEEKDKGKDDKAKEDAASASA